MIPEVTPGALLEMALRTYRTHPARVLVPAVFVFGVVAVADTIVVRLDNHASVVIAAIVLAAQAVASLGLTFYAGLLDRLLGAVERGQVPPPALRVLRTLPYVRLVAADLVLTVIDVVATATFVLPGLILFTLFAIVGPLINLEGHGVVSAFRHSARLVRPHFWVAALLITVPVAIEREVTGAVELLVPHQAVGLVILTEAVVGIAFGTVIGLLEVALAETLVRRSKSGLVAAEAVELLEGVSAPRDDRPAAPAVDRPPQA